MKSWFQKSDDYNTVLELHEVPKPKPKAGEILVKVHAASLNRGEFIVKHTPDNRVIEKPCGIECAGEVREVGSGNVDVKPGDRIMGRATMAFSEFALIRAENSIKIPERLTWEEAGAATITYMTAHDMLWQGGNLKPNEWLLITSVSSGVGVAALQLGKMIGAKVIGTSRSLKKLNSLKKLGLDFGLLYSEQGFESQVMKITGGKGVDLIVNTVGGSVFEECIRILAFQGRLATVGYVDGVTKVELDLLEQHAKRLKLFGVSNKQRSSEDIAKSVNNFTCDVLPAMANGQITPVIDRTYKFNALPKALERINSNIHFGKIVITI